MKKNLIWSLSVLIAVALMFWLVPRYTLVGILCLAAGWCGHILYTKRVGR